MNPNFMKNSTTQQDAVRQLSANFRLRRKKQKVTMAKEELVVSSRRLTLIDIAANYLKPNDGGEPNKLLARKGSATVSVMRWVRRARKVSHDEVQAYHQTVRYVIV